MLSSFFLQYTSAPTNTTQESARAGLSSGWVPVVNQLW